MVDKITQNPDNKEEFYLEMNFIPDGKTKSASILSNKVASIYKLI